MWGLNSSIQKDYSPRPIEHPESNELIVYKGTVDVSKLGACPGNVTDLLWTSLDNEKIIDALAFEGKKVVEQYKKTISA